MSHTLESLLCVLTAIVIARVFVTTVQDILDLFHLLVNCDDCGDSH